MSLDGYKGVSDCLKLGYNYHVDRTHFDKPRFFGFFLVTHFQCDQAIFPMYGEIESVFFTLSPRKLPSSGNQPGRHLNPDIGQGELTHQVGIVVQG